MKRADYMTETQKDAMGKKPRHHYICKELTKVMRPGKTAHDRANGAAPSKAERNARQAAYREACDKQGGKRK